jgi:glycogen debranching enzyme
VTGPQEAERTFHSLLSTYSDLRDNTAASYRQYLNQTVSLELPDAQLQQAYDWARISILQGLVSNPYLGTGLIAGYRTSGTYERPGFAWFFGRDALWTSLALNAEGDFASSRTALDFLSRYQRSDGKVPHEIAQTASLLPWFQDYPYAYASADATPLYVVTVDDYVTKSGDVTFATEKWDSLWKAYQFLKSTYGAHGLPQNLGFGHGWVEGGPLLPVETELYQSALGAESLKALAHLAQAVGKGDVSHQLETEFAHQKELLNQAFWSKEKNLYGFALDKNGQRVDTASVLAAVPMWFDLLDSDKAEAMIDQLADPVHQADWGMRIISSDNPLYNPGGYHYGAVWPLFTGWASVGEYRYHRAGPAYSNLRANSLLPLDGALGHVTEVLSGNYYQPLSTSSPHQIWSAAMVVSPLLRGLLGLETDSASHHVRFAPHVPADWKTFAVHGIHMLTATVDLAYQRTEDEIVLDVRRYGSMNCDLDFSPAISPRAEILSAELNGRPVPVHIQRNTEDQHVSVHFGVFGGSNTLRIHLRNDFGISVPSTLPARGERSQGLRIVSQTWRPESLTINLSGIAGRTYDLSVWNPAQISGIDGAEVIKNGNQMTGVRVQLPGTDNGSYARGKVVFLFSGKTGEATKRQR